MSEATLPLGFLHVGLGGGTGPHLWLKLTHHPENQTPFPLPAWGKEKYSEFRSSRSSQEQCHFPLGCWVEDPIAAMASSSRDS